MAIKQTKDCANANKASWTDNCTFLPTFS